MNQTSIDVRLVDNEDSSTWNDYVNSHPKASPYHLYGWLSAVNTAYGHTISGAIATDNSTGKVVGIFPAITMSIPFWGRQVCSLPYCDVGYGLADNEQILSTMQSYLIEQIQTSSAKYHEVRGLLPAPMDSHSMEHQKVRMLLELPEGSEALLASFKSKLRSQIRKAEKNGLTFQLGQSTKLLDDFYSVYAENMRDLGSPAHARKWFRAIVDAYQEDCVISVVYLDDLPIGAGIVLSCNTKACIPWASTLQRHNRLAPNMLLYWSLLAHCADNNKQEFDFGRSTYEEGTYRFKKQWGAQPQLLNWQKLNQNKETIPQAFTEPGQSRALVENIWKKLPVSVSVLLGSRLRPFISL
ncbi:GNAT family N-acetyltransferase [Alteromonas sp. H39]|uniref:GNAT family N-acetyltransferase n=1 Tax=Alteromonas sp. H39 TaxID=3389876 RepID=UPI0039E07DAF